MTQIPRDPAIDSTLNMLREGYDFIWNRCRRFGSDIFQTRILGQRTICIHGPEAAELFYDESKFQRRNAIPRRVVTSLFGKNALHTLEGEEHRNRKAAFLALMSPASLARLMDETAQQWRMAIHRWENQECVVLFDETQRILTRAMCAWTGVPLPEAEAPRRARDFSRMVDAFGGVGPRLWNGKLARIATQAWIGRIIESVRRGQMQVDAESALGIMASHRGLNGRLLDTKTAAVELINVIRPTVAVSWYITFAALALHQHPASRRRILEESAGHGEYTDLFMQEVRRFYPFTPYLGALVRKSFEWKGHHFQKGRLVLLDVHGTDHDPRIWEQPHEFWPERFQRWNGSAYNFIPQGGGPRVQGHRCPGEWITMHNVALALHFLTRTITYDVPKQDLRFDITRMPTAPRSGFVMRNVRATAALHQEVPRYP
ncbi:MAG TPA: cytochrome P450, partial [Candidatus Angelobacter sp.]|nr:cytochrome P450 [Candidatus Angelobacter sp.]